MYVVVLMYVLSLLKVLCLSVVYTKLQPELLLYSTEKKIIFLFSSSLSGTSLLRGGPWLPGHKESEEIELGKE